MSQLFDRFLLLAVLVVAFPLFIALTGCPDAKPSPNQAVGENIQLQQRLEEKVAAIATLERERKELIEQNTRLQTRLAEAASGTYEVGEQQQLLDERKATIDAREQNVVAREKTVESQLSQRRAELTNEMKAREADITRREATIATKEKEFYEATSLSMEEIGEAREIKEQYENMRRERDTANQTAERWLSFVWYVTLALLAAIIICATLTTVLVSKYKARQQEVEVHQKQIGLVAEMMKARLPAEYSPVVIEALGNIAAIEQKPVSDEKTEPGD